MIQTFRPSRDDERGAILIISSVILTSLIAMTALVVDIGHQSMDKRHLHAIADMAAQDALYALAANFSTNCSGQPDIKTCAQFLAQQSSASNGFAVGGDNSLVATIGTWDTTNNVFVPLDQAGTDEAGESSTTLEVDADTQSDATAVQVVATTVFHSQFIVSSFHLSATATAEIGGAGVEVGTYAAGINDSVIGPLLGEPTGGVTLAGYQGLAAAAVTLGQLAAAGGFATPNDLLNANVTAKDVITWTAKVLDPNGNSSSAAATAIEKLKADVTTSDAAWANTSFQFRKLFHSGSGSAGTGLGIGDGSVAQSNTAVNVLKLVTAAPEFQLINGTNVVSMNIPISLSVPGLLSASATMKTTFLEGPQIAYGPIGTTASTAQVRSVFELTGAVAVSVVGLGVTIVNFDLPIVLEGFGGSGTIVKIWCGSPTNEVDINSTPSAATAGIGDTTGFNFSAAVPSHLPSKNLLSIGGVGVLGGSTVVSVGQPPPKLEMFQTPPEPWTGAPLARGPQTTSTLSAGKALDVNLTGAQRVVNDAQLLLGSTLITSATANFTSGDVGSSLSGLGIPAGTTIVSVQSSTTATMSTSATSNQSNDSVTIGPASGGGSLTFLGGPLPIGTLVNSVLDPVLSQVDSLLQPVGIALGVTFAGLDTYNPAFPGTSAPPGINCSSGQLLQ